MIYLAFRKPSDETFNGTDLRCKPRIYDPILLRVRGVSASGKRYEFESIAFNIGPGGLCTTAPRIVGAGDNLFFFVRFSRNGSTPDIAPALVARGIVLRTLEGQNGLLQFAAYFTHRKILFISDNPQRAAN